MASPGEFETVHNLSQEDDGAAQGHPEGRVTASQSEAGAQVILEESNAQ